MCLLYRVFFSVCFIFFRQGLLLCHRLASNSSCRQGWPWSPDYFASKVLRVGCHPAPVNAVLELLGFPAGRVRTWPTELHHQPLCMDLYCWEGSWTAYVIYLNEHLMILKNNEETIRFNIHFCFQSNFAFLFFALMHVWSKMEKIRQVSLKISEILKYLVLRLEVSWYDCCLGGFGVYLLSFRHMGRWFQSKNLGLWSQLRRRVLSLVLPAL